MTQIQASQKTPTGTAWIVWGSVFLALGLLALIRAPLVVLGGDGYEAGGAIVAVIFWAGLGSWWLVKGLNKRKRHNAG